MTTDESIGRVARKLEADEFARLLEENARLRAENARLRGEIEFYPQMKERFAMLLADVEAERARLRAAMQPLADIEPELMYVEARVGSNNYSGEFIRLIVDRRGMETTKSKYENEHMENWLRNQITIARAALAAAEHKGK